MPFRKISPPKKTTHPSQNQTERSRRGTNTVYIINARAKTKMLTMEMAFSQTVSKAGRRNNRAENPFGEEEIRSRLVSPKAAVNHQAESHPTFSSGTKDISRVLDWEHRPADGKRPRESLQLADLSFGRLRPCLTLSKSALNRADLLGQIINPCVEILDRLSQFAMGARSGTPSDPPGERG